MYAMHMMQIIMLWFYIIDTAGVVSINLCGRINFLEGDDITMEN